MSHRKAYEPRAKADARDAGKAWAVNAGFLHPIKVDAFGETWERVYLLHGTPSQDDAMAIAKVILRGRGASQAANQTGFGLRVSIGRCEATCEAALSYRATHKPTAGRDADVATVEKALARATASGRPAKVVETAIRLGYHAMPQPSTTDELHAVPPPCRSTSGAGLDIDVVRLVAAIADNPTAKRALVAALLADES